jgi:hypothetical protein
MRDDKERVSSSIAAMPRPGCDSFDDRSVTEKDGNLDDESAGRPKAKRPYGKPTYRFERVFETMALSCGKVHGVESQCRFNRHTS